MRTSPCPSTNFKVEWDVIIRTHLNTPGCKVHCKPTNCNSFIHYFSFHHRPINLSAIASMFLTALRIFSPQHLHDKNNNIWKISCNLKYPDRLVQPGDLVAHRTLCIRNTSTRMTTLLSLTDVLHVENMKEVGQKLGLQIGLKYTSTLKSLLIRNSSRNSCVGPKLL